MQHNFMSIEENKPAMQALLVLAFDLYHLEMTDGYDGSDIAIANQNKAAELLNEIFEMDCIEHPDWEHLVQCTQEEIALFCINKLLHKFTGSWPTPKGEPLYIVVFENPFFGDPESLLDEEREDFALEDLDIQVWTAANLSVDAGWGDDESKELLALERYHAALSYGDHAQSIFRVV
ncbi:hypothetical protein [Vibrio sp. 10N.239.312.D08]|uniref:hypothetical protein n=1 Tax=Vibrio sp. 10N.239.312.D08 TaxID=3229978 RepID=UPI00354FF7A3